MFKNELEEYLTFCQVHYLNGSISDSIQYNMLIVACIVWKKSYDEIASLSMDIIEDLYDEKLEKITNYFTNKNAQIVNEIYVKGVSEATQKKRLSLIQKISNKEKGRFQSSIEKELSNLDSKEEEIMKLTISEKSLSDFMTELKREI